VTKLVCLVKFCSVQWALKGGVTTTASGTELRRTGTCGFRLVARAMQYPHTILSRKRTLPAWSRPEVLPCLPLSFARAISRCAATSAPFVGSLHMHPSNVQFSSLQVLQHIVAKVAQSICSEHGMTADPTGIWLRVCLPVSRL
jgi:hypothetical protein